MSNENNTVSEQTTSFEKLISLAISLVRSLENDSLANIYQLKLNDHLNYKASGLLYISNPPQE